MYRNILYILLSILFLIIGCGKHSHSPEESTGQRPEAYIFFSQSVDTEAQLVNKKEDLNGQSFGVLGFKYDKASDWNAYKSTSPTPNVFYDGNALVDVESVTCDADGYGSYEPLQGWSNSKKYTFFAYYPIDNDDVQLVSASGGVGTPAIKYTMGTGNDFKTSMVDILTASQTDKYYMSSDENNITDANGNSDIKFTFSHRLSCLGVKVKNSSSGSIMISSLTVKLKGIKYQKIIIPLDGTEVTKTGSDMDINIPLELDTDEQLIATSAGEVELADKLIFIPQSDNMSIQMQLEYIRIPYGDYIGCNDDITLPDMNTKLTEGTKHLVSLNFTDSNVEISGIADTGWIELPEVTDTFN